MQTDTGQFVYEKSLKKPGGAFMRKIKFVDKYINRPMASLIVKAVFKTPVTPNGLTYFSFLIGLVGAYFFSRGTYMYIILGGLFAQLSSIIDGADGMLARAKNMCSEYGSHLDLFFDRIMDFFVIIGISIGASVYYDNPTFSLLGFLAAGLYLLQINLFYLTKSYLQVKDKGDTGEARAILFWGFLILSVLNRLDICIYLLLLETVIANIARLIYFMRLRLPASPGNGSHHADKPDTGPQKGDNSSH